MKTLIISFLVSLTQVAFSQTWTSAKNQFDSNFPAKGKFNASALTSFSAKNPPPILVGDVSYGVTNKFSVGVVGGTLGVMALYGIKLNAVIFHQNNFRINFKMLTVYYPERNGQFMFDRTSRHIMPWMLSSGIIDAEWKTPRNIRWSIGAGFTETHCIEGMYRNFRNLFGHKASPSDTELPFDVLTTIKGSVSVPLSKKFTLRPEGWANFQHGKLIQHGAHKVGFPIIVSATVIYSF